MVGAGREERVEENAGGKHDGRKDLRMCVGWLRGWKWGGSEAEMCWSVTQSVAQSDDHAVRQSFSQSASESVNQPAKQSVSLSVSRAVIQSASQSVVQLANEA